MNLKILVGLFILGIIILSAMTFLNFTSIVAQDKGDQQPKGPIVYTYDEYNGTYFPHLLTGVYFPCNATFSNLGLPSV